MTDHTTQLALSTDTPLMGWEPADAYNELLTDLEAEHQPTGATERHLVEELALTMWRRKRLQIAEQAELLKSTPISTQGPGASFVQRHGAAMIGHELPTLDPSELMRLSDQEVRAELEELAHEINVSEKALSLLDSNRKADYRKAVQVLNEIDWGWIEEPEWEADAADLESNISEYLRQTLHPRVSVLQNVRVLRSLTTAYSYAGADVLKLMKVDLALSKKLEKTLAMLLRLQQIRVEKAQKPSVSN